MPIDVKVSCDSGSSHEGPFFSVMVRMRQVGVPHGDRVDRMKVMGVYCQDCIEAGIVLPADLLDMRRQIPSLGGSGGGVAGESPLVPSRGVNGVDL